MDGDASLSGGGRWWGGPTPGAATPASTDVMNQLCRVCGEPAAGFHFGAFTCEGCKSFFGRTYNNLSSISECKNNGCCVINKKNRTSCKACRLRKCLMVGMSKSGSRYGRRSNWFKIHCLLQEQQQQHQQSHQQQQQKVKEWDGSLQFYKGHEDNNNVPNKTGIQAGPSFQQAAAFWAARSSFMSHPIPMAFPFLHPPSFPPPRGLLLPFVNPVVPPAPSPSSSTSSSSPPLVLDDRGHRDLGPVQEQPIDLSVRKRVEVDVDDDDDVGTRRPPTPLDLTTKT